MRRLLITGLERRRPACNAAIAVSTAGRRLPPRVISTRKPPLFRLLTQARLHRIVLDISNNTSVVSRVPYVPVERLDLPETAAPSKQLVRLMSCVRLYRMQWLRAQLRQKE